MKKGFLLFAVTCWALLVFIPKASAQQEEAGVIVYPSISFMQVAGSLAGDENTLSIDLRAGYRISSGFYFGMIYNNTSGGGTDSLNGSALGNSIGYFGGMFSVIASYYLNASMNENTPTASLQRSQGNGIQLDFAINLPVSPDFYIGPMITYKAMTYNAETFAGAFP